MLLQFGDEYKLVLRLVVVALIVPGDTSECERIFSLMNNIKTVDRARMGQRTLTEEPHAMARDGKRARTGASARDGHPQGVSYNGWPSRPQSSPPCESYHL